MPPNARENTPLVKRALVSVYDKNRLTEFCKVLSDEFGAEIVSTGGTADLLFQSGLSVTRVEDVTGSPEMLGGRVKTLHPAIHAAILADRDNPDHVRQLSASSIDPIDLVVVNLYPFDATVADSHCTFEAAIDIIDIGGPCMLRAAAKNHKHVLAVHDPATYDVVIQVLRSRSTEQLASLRIRLARSAFEKTSAYDRCVADYLAKRSIDLPADGDDPLFEFPAVADLWPLRYGENPHQPGALRRIPAETKREPGDEAVVAAAPPNENMSFNNYVDADAALALCKDLARAAAASELGNANANALPKFNASFIKHTNPCGCAVDDDPVDAYRKAYLGDPRAAMGGILAFSFPVNEQLASIIMETYHRWGKAAGAGGFFVEVLVAPAVDDQARQIIQTRNPWGRRVRIIEVGNLSAPPDPHRPEFRRIAGGVLFQSRDLSVDDPESWRVVTRRAPTDRESADLRQAWIICKHTRSNAVTLTRDAMLIGNGPGQSSRLMSCRLAAWSAQNNGHAHALRGAAAASDAFFPFRDGPELLIEAGVRAIIQPGGSKHDDDTIAACNQRDVAMVLTGTRHFRH